MTPRLCALFQRLRHRSDAGPTQPPSPPPAEPLLTIHDSAPGEARITRVRVLRPCCVIQRGRAHTFRAGQVTGLTPSTAAQLAQAGAVVVIPFEFGAHP